MEKQFTRKGTDFLVNTKEFYDINKAVTMTVLE